MLTKWKTSGSLDFKIATTGHLLKATSTRMVQIGYHNFHKFNNIKKIESENKKICIIKIWGTIGRNLLGRRHKMEKLNLIRIKLIR